MANEIAANGKEAAYFGVPWENAYGYAQAIKVKDTIYVSGQLSHDDKGKLVAPAALDKFGKAAEFSTMEQQMRTTYANAVKLLARFWGDTGQCRRGDALRSRCRRRVCCCRQGTQGGFWNGATSVRQQSDRRIKTCLS